MPKRTYQPHKRRRARVHGFLSSARKKTVIARRRKRGRAKLAPTS